MVYAQPNICPGEWYTQTPLGFWHKTDNLILARRLDLIIINKKKKRTCKIVDFTVPVDPRIKVKVKRRINTRTLLGNWKNKQTVEHESDVYANCNWCSWYSRRRIIKGTRGLGKKRTSGDHPNYWDRPEYWEEFWRLEGTCCHSNSNEKPSANADVKNSYNNNNKKKKKKKKKT